MDSPATPKPARPKKRFRRSLYIFLLSLLAVAFFAGTFAINRLFAQQQHRLGVYWFEQGQRALTQDKATDAISDLRTALVYSHDDHRYLFALAQALEAANHLPEARSYFLSLLEDQPGNGAVNLELAHLSVKDKDLDRSLRYFNGAIYGAWDADPILKRQQARQELINYLISAGRKTQARGELLTFSTELPNTVNSKFWVAQGFNRLGDDRSALEFYTAALRLNPRDVGALLGAGWSNFRLSHYREALDYFQKAQEIHSDPSTSQMVQLLTAVVELNPFDTRISSSERRHRLLLAMEIVDRRIQQCSDVEQIPLDTVGKEPLQLARSRWKYLDGQIRNARREADLVPLLSPVATLVTTVEQQSGCGVATADDQAMLRIYQNSEELRP